MDEVAAASLGSLRPVGNSASRVCGVLLRCPSRVRRGLCRSPTSETATQSGGTPWSRSGSGCRRPTTHTTAAPCAGDGATSASRNVTGRQRPARSTHTRRHGGSCSASLQRRPHRRTRAPPPPPSRLDISALNWCCRGCRSRSSSGKRRPGPGLQAAAPRRRRAALLPGRVRKRGRGAGRAAAAASLLRAGAIHRLARCLIGRRGVRQGWPPWKQCRWWHPQCLLAGGGAAGESGLLGWPEQSRTAATAPMTLSRTLTAKPTAWLSWLCSCGPGAPGGSRAASCTAV